MGFSLKSVIKGVESVARVAVAPATGLFSLAQNKNQAIAIAGGHAVAAAAVGGAILAPGATAAIGSKVGGAALGVGAAVAARRWSGPAPAPSSPMPAQASPYAPDPGAAANLTAPPQITVNSTLAPGAAPVAAPSSGTDKALLIGAAALAAKLLFLS